MTTTKHEWNSGKTDGDIQMKEVPEKHPEFDPETYTDPIFEECCCIVGFAIDPDETPVST